VTSPPKPAETPPVAGAGAGDTPAAADAPRHESPADPSRDEHAPCAGSVQGHTPASSSPGSLQPIDGGDTTSGNTSTVSDRSSSLSPSTQRERRPRGPPLPRLLLRQFQHRGWVYSGEQTRLTSRKRPSAWGLEWFRRLLERDGQTAGKITRKSAKVHYGREQGKATVRGGEGGDPVPGLGPAWERGPPLHALRQSVMPLHGRAPRTPGPLLPPVVPQDPRQDPQSQALRGPSPPVPRVVRQPQASQEARPQARGPCSSRNRPSPWRDIAIMKCGKCVRLLPWVA